MLSNYVKPGDKIEMSVVRTLSGSEERKVYKSKVYDIVSEDEIKIVMPMEKGKLVLLPVDGEYDLYFYTEGGLFQCSAKVADRYKTNNVYMLTMELTSSLRKFQRREYYRLNCVLNMKCTCVSESDLEKLGHSVGVEFIETDFTLQDGVIVDISGGGARFISGEEYEKGMTMLFVFSLTVSASAMQYSVLGRIVSSSEIDGKDGQFENRVQFIDMDDEEREGIIRFIFEEERKIRRREKI